MQGSAYAYVTYCKYWIIGAAGAAEKAVLTTVHRKKKIQKIPLLDYHDGY
jgi:hypothetical protein